MSKIRLALDGQLHIKQKAVVITNYTLTKFFAPRYYYYLDSILGNYLMKFVFLVVVVKCFDGVYFHKELKVS